MRQGAIFRGMAAPQGSGGGKGQLHPGGTQGVADGRVRGLRGTGSTHPRVFSWWDFQGFDRDHVGGPVQDGGYQDPRWWMSDGWPVAQAEGWQAHVPK